jgi:hypothetical protein
MIKEFDPCNIFRTYNIEILSDTMLVHMIKEFDLYISLVTGHNGIDILSENWKYVSKYRRDRKKRKKLFL